MTADVTPTPIALAVGKRLPLDIAVQLLSAGDGSNGAISFEMGCVLMKLERPTQQEIKDFSGKASVRVGDFGSFMLFSPSFKGFSFDLLWSPVIARAQDKPVSSPKMQASICC